MSSRSGTSGRTSLQVARARAPRHRDLRPREPLLDARPTNAPDRRRSPGGSQRTTSSSRAPRSATRRQAEIEPRLLKKSNPAGAGQKQSIALQANTIMGRARRAQAEKYYAHQHRVPELPAARRGPLLSRVRVRAGERARQRAPGLLRAHPEPAELEVHPERLSRVRRALLQRGAGRSEQMGHRGAGVYARSSSTRRRTTRSTATPGTSSPTSSGTRAISPKALNAFKKTIDYGVTYAQLPNATKLAERRAPRHYPGLRARAAIRRRPTTSSTTCRVTSRARTTRRSR